MSSLEKLKKKLINNPKNIRFEELVRVLHDLGYKKVRSKGSHHIFRPEKTGHSILIVKPHGNRTFCSQVDIKKVLELLEAQEKENKNEN